MPNNIRFVLASSVAAALAAAACHSRSTTSPEPSQPAPAPAAPPAETVADEPAPAPAQGSASALALADFEGDRCSPEELVLRFGAMKPARPVDYLELRVSSNRNRRGNHSEAQQSFGTSCKGAPDPKTCSAASTRARAAASRRRSTPR